MRCRLLILLLLSFLLSCSSSGNEESEYSGELPNGSYPELMHQVWQAHGGIENWKNYRAISFTVTRPGQQGKEIHQVNLDDRKVLIHADSFRIGMDGRNVWAAPTLDAYDGNPRFYHNLVFYFFNLPFLMADDGVNTSDAGMMTLDGREYPAVRVDFDQGTGDADDDEYFLLIDPETRRIDWILYTVTYFVHEKVTSYSALNYQDYMTVEGLKFPSKLIGYQYANDTTGARRYEIGFSDVSLSAEPYPARVFEKPVAGEYVKD